MLKQQAYVSIVGSIVTGIVTMATIGSLSQALLSASVTFLATSALIAFERAVKMPETSGHYPKGPKQN